MDFVVGLWKGMKFYETNSDTNPANRIHEELRNC